MNKIQVGLCSTLLMCIFTCSIETQNHSFEDFAKEFHDMSPKQPQPGSDHPTTYNQQIQIIAQNQAELIKILLQSEEPQLARKEKLLAAGKRWNKLRTTLLYTSGGLVALAIICENRAIPVLQALVLMGLRACITHTDTEKLQSDIDDGSKHTVESLKAMLATLQTKTSISPKTKK